MSLPPRCEAQVGHRLVLWLNAVLIPRARYCPRNAEPGSPYCAGHTAALRVPQEENDGK